MLGAVGSVACPLLLFNDENAVGRPAVGEILDDRAAAAGGVGIDGDLPDDPVADVAGEAAEIVQGDDPDIRVYRTRSRAAGRFSGPCP